MLNQLSGDPNCELFPQGPIIPVPPCTPPYRPVRTCGNNWAVSPGKHAKRKLSNQRVREQLFPLFRWWLCFEAMPKQHQCPSPPCSGKNSHGRVSGPARWLVSGRRGNPRLNRGASRPGNMCRPARATTAIQPCPPFPAAIEVDDGTAGLI